LPNTMISETLHGYLHQYAAPSRGSPGALDYARACTRPVARAPYRLCQSGDASCLIPI
jgi:hypothetical protein